MLLHSDTAYDQFVTLIINYAYHIKDGFINT